ncbi:MAG: methyltransferase [Pseudomonadota bacterium]
MTTPDAATLTCDAFLGGALQIWQPQRGYRAGIDAVLLAAAVRAQPGQSVLDLGCGVGVAGLSLARRVGNLHVAGIERQPFYADLAQRNARENGIDADIVQADLADMPTGLRARQFDHVLANPPYFDRERGARAPDAHRETALGEDTPLQDWVRIAAKRTRPGGSVTFIQRAERLPELLAHATGCLGSIEILPLLPRAGRPARLVLMRARNGGRAPFHLHAGCVLHSGSSHTRDADDYTAPIAAVLRNPSELNF